MTMALGLPPEERLRLAHELEAADPAYAAWVDAQADAREAATTSAFTCTVCGDSYDPFDGELCTCSRRELANMKTACHERCAETKLAKAV